MIEVPVAAALVELTPKESGLDISIGTNDLIEYYLAVDRSNEFVNSTSTSRSTRRSSG